MIQTSFGRGARGAAAVVVAGWALALTGAEEARAQSGSPVVQAVAPSRLAQGILGRRVQLRGANLGPDLQLSGAVFLGPGSAPPLAVRASGFRVFPPSAATFLVSVSRDAPEGDYRFDLVDPSPPLPAVVASFTVRVISARSVAAPLAVTGIAVVHPPPGSRLVRGRPVRPRGRITTTGHGVVTGAWLLDGIPFERFHAVARGGDPVSVEASLPIPDRGQGSHHLELRVERPAEVSSDPVELFQTVRGEARFRLTAPPDGAVLVLPRRLEVRWTAQPWAEAYQVLLSPVPRVERRTVRVQVAGSPWRGEGVEGLCPGRWYVSVRPLFAGRVPGDPGRWRAVSLVTTPGTEPEKPGAPAAGHRGLRLLEPAPGSTVPATPGRIVVAAPGLAGTDLKRLSVVLDGETDLTALASWEEDRLAVRPPFPLDPGPHWVFVAVGERHGAWSFHVGSGRIPGQAAGRAGAAAETSAAPPTTWGLEGNLAGAWVSGGEPDEQEALRLELAGSVDHPGEVWQVSASGEAVGDARPVDEGTARQASRSAAARLLWARKGLDGAIQLGYVSPEGLDGSEFADTGTLRAGAEAGVGGSRWQAGVYATVDPELDNVITGELGPEQRIRAGSLAWVLPGGRGFARAAWVDVHDPGDPLQALEPRDGRTASVWISMDLDRWRLDGEWAHSRTTPRGQPEAEGDAWRIGVQGKAGGTDLRLDVRALGSQFRNAAAGRLVEGTNPDRFEVSVRGGRDLGERVRLDVSYRRADSGTDSGDPSAEGTLDAASADLWWAADDRSSVGLTARWSEARAPTGSVLTGSRAAGAGLRYSWTDDRWSVSWMLDRETVAALEAPGEPEVRTTHASVTGQADWDGPWSLTGGFGWTEVRQDVFGAGRDWVLYLQPEWRLETGFSVLGSVSQAHGGGDDFLPGRTVRSASWIASWQTPWRNGGLGMEFVAGWDQVRGGIPGEAAEESLRYQATVSWKWGWPRESTARDLEGFPPISRRTISARRVADRRGRW